ncbi:MAG: HAMP domain-containing sensor histidine kinase [Clostridium sp.]|nr:HAMP domain-containing sensor histidine kinase [Clostridium sp.]
MLKSIRYKLFIGISSLIIFFVLFSLLLNTQYLEKYYLNEKKDMLIKNSTLINQSYKGNPADIALELEKLETSSTLNMIIADSSGKIKYSTFSRVLNEKPFFRKPIAPPDSDSESSLRRNDSRIFGRKINPAPNTKMDLESLSEIISLYMPDSEKYMFLTQKDKDLKIDFLVLKTTLSNGDSLIIRTPLPAITENANTANKFMMFTGILVLLIGGIWAYLFSKNFTKPILELNSVSQNMANLDFSKKCNINDENEIGELAKSINYLSEKLDNAISELNEKNRKLMEDIERERKIDEMRKEFVSNVSHELKTPISLIQGYSEGLRSNVIQNADDKDFYCNVIINETARMDKIVKDLLNLSQIESGYFKLEKTVFNISSLIDSILSKYRAIFEEKQIKINVTKEPTVTVCGDIVRIEQVIINYINNAINHVNNHKIINITVVALEEKVKFEIFNSGDPIQEEALDKIWISFYKVDKARTRKYGGSGLGLSIVKAVQNLHGNECGVKNLDNGVMFWFDIYKA